MAFVVLAVFENISEAQMLQNKEIQVNNNTPLPESRAWNLVEKMDEKDDLLRDLFLNVSTKSLDFYETRVIQNGGQISSSKKKLTEQNKDIGMKIMDMDTGEIQIIKISIRVKKEGIEIISPPGYQISIADRTSGIKWNKWNTLYKITSPIKWVVLKNKYPDVTATTQRVIVKDKTGRKKTVTRKVYTVEEFIYSPYSGDLHAPELIGAGQEYLKSVVTSAIADLKNKQVPSRSLAGQMVADISALSPSFFTRLPLLEQTDMTEFNADPQMTIERIFVIIGTNKDVAFKKTGSKAGALGWVQFTKTTYNSIRKAYPSAKLMTDFETGAADHLNSMKAAILLYDYNLNDLVRKHGKKILGDPRLEEYLAAAYNGRPSRVSLSLRASIAANLGDWIYALSAKKGGLAEETKGYMIKIRYLREKELL